VAKFLITRRVGTSHTGINRKLLIKFLEQSLILCVRLFSLYPYRDASMTPRDVYLKTALGLTLSIIASCQGHTQEPPLPPLNGEGINLYCIFNSRVYSVGSILCSPQSKATLICESNADEQNKSGTGRAVWTRKAAESQCK